jgi:ABC-type iron transport system FetAB ATPase subunit
MQLNEFYKSRVEEYTRTSNLLKRKENQLSVGRLGVFILSIVLFYVLFSVSVAFAVIIFVTGLFSLGWLIQYQNGIIRKKEYYEHLSIINQLELKSIEGDYSSFPDGSEYLDKNHPYTYDLDIFGRASLFQFLNRTISKPAADMLAEWLKAPGTRDQILLRQQAVTELKEMADWRQQLMALGYEYKDAASHPGTVLQWVTSSNIFLGKKLLRILTIILSLLSLAAIVLVIKGMPMALLIIVISANMLVNYKYLKLVTNLHQQVSKSYEMLQSYGRAIKLIENQKFTSGRMQFILSQLYGTGSASGIIHKLSALVNKLDLRLNVMVSLPLNIFFFWDIHVCYQLEKWKQHNAPYIARWFASMAEVEVLSSIANTSFNNPRWVFPKITDEYFILNGEVMGHPLIPADRRVSNDFIVDGAGKIVLVTGSNMSGKSTFQRTCGVNMVLAFAGSPVCATSFEVSLVKILTSMRISDSLEDNTSSFYAELKRLAMIIRESEVNRNVFLLLDEILRGTNSNDRHIGSEALIRQLIQQDTTAVVATHDLSLSELEKELPEKIDNYNFDVKIMGEELFFDYKLNQGICKSLNASILMKKMGIKV